MPAVQFSYPWLLTSIHAGSASIGCYLLLLRGHFSLTKLTVQQELTLAAFSVLFTINIAVSNVSLYVFPFFSCPPPNLYSGGCTQSYEGFEG